MYSWVYLVYFHSLFEQLNIDKESVPFCRLVFSPSWFSCINAFWNCIHKMKESHFTEQFIMNAGSYISVISQQHQMITMSGRNGCVSWSVCCPCRKKLQLPEWLSFRMINNFMALFVISEMSNIMSIYWYYTLGIWCLEVNLLRPLHLYRSLSNQRSVIDCLNTEGCHSNNIKKIHKALLHKCCFKLQLKQLIW